MIAQWRPAHVARLPAQPPAPPVITAGDARRILPDHDLWDMWPLTLHDGTTAIVDDGILWFALAAPLCPDPVDRHAHARIRLLHARRDTWRDLGDALPDGLNPGSREWSGSAILDPGTEAVILFYTAAGRRGEPAPSFEQRLFQLAGTLRRSPTLPSVQWHCTPIESIAADDAVYTRADQVTGAPGEIKAFRDPAFVQDPADGACYLLFAASLKTARHTANGAVGLARADDATLHHWRLLPPLLEADGLNNELERPHIVVRDGRYYLFWSTQRHTFTAGQGPTGLYGAVADRLPGPYRFLNGSGLVLANPASEPMQAYSWWVMADATVTSFIDYWGLQGRSLAGAPDLARRQFGGTPAPLLRLRLHDDRAELC